MADDDDDDDDDGTICYLTLSVQPENRADRSFHLARRLHGQKEESDTAPRRQRPRSSSGFQFQGPAVPQWPSKEPVLLPFSTKHPF